MATLLARTLVNLSAVALTGAALLFSMPGGRAEASSVVARVSVSEQRMDVSIDGRAAFAWKVSTAGKGYSTPRGKFRPTRMHRMWHSRKYDMAPMPHSIFFHGGYAIHATEHVRMLGRPASHGCVRLHPEAAEDFFEIVRAFGPANTRIVIVD